jgi:hypothetical protein
MSFFLSTFNAVIKFRPQYSVPNSKCNRNWDASTEPRLGCLCDEFQFRLIPPQAESPVKMSRMSRILANVSYKTKVLLLHLSSTQLFHELSVHDIVHVGLAHEEIFVSSLS